MCLSSSLVELLSTRFTKWDSWRKCYFCQICSVSTSDETKSNVFSVHAKRFVTAHHTQWCCGNDFISKGKGIWSELIKKKMDGVKSRARHARKPIRHCRPPEPDRTIVLPNNGLSIQPELYCNGLDETYLEVGCSTFTCRDFSWYLCVMLFNHLKLPSTKGVKIVAFIVEKNCSEFIGISTKKKCHVQKYW